MQSSTKPESTSRMSADTTLRRVIFTRLLLIASGALLLFAAALVVLGLLPLHQRLAASEFARVAHEVGDALDATVSEPARMLLPASDWMAGQPPPFAEPESIERHFMPMLRHFEQISSVVLGSHDGRAWMLLRQPDGSWRSRRTDLVAWGERHLILEQAADGTRTEHWKTLRYDARTRPWYAGAIASAAAAAHWTEPYTFFTTGNPGITVSRRFRFADGSDAVLGFDVKLTDLSVATREARIGVDGMAMVLTKDERVLGLPRRPEGVSDAEWQGILLLPASALGLPAVDAALAAWRQGGRSGYAARRVEAGGRAWLAAVDAHPLGEHRLWILTLAPATEFAPDWAGIVQGLAGSVVLLLAIAALVARRQAQRIAAPLESLARMGRRMGELDFSVPAAPHTRIAEISALGAALEDMRGQLARNQESLDAQAARLHAQVEELSDAERRIHALAYYDPLTQLPNRRLLTDRLGHAMAASSRRNTRCALMLLDLDDFKTLNDTLGHDHGDELLREVARRLTHTVRAVDTVARLGGDEFVVVLEDLSTDEDAARQQAADVGRKILAVVEQAYAFQRFEARTSASIGAVVFGAGEDSAETLLKHADMAMYESKASGRNCLRFFGPEMAARLRERTRLEADLRLALERGEFALHYQPQFDAGGRMVGAEALLRWTHPEHGALSPERFIPVAEACGLIVPLGNWVIDTACHQLRAWAQDPRLAQLELAVNVSARQFRQADFAEVVAATLARTGAPGRRLKIEITESMLLEDMEAVVARMQQLQALGIGFALDDFGTGYSSLTYLKRLPLTDLKIDRSFVRDVLSDPNDAAIARTIIALGETMGLRVIAEGVESEAQFEFLARSGCHRFQGYHFGRPGPLAALAAHLPRGPG